MSAVLGLDVETASRLSRAVGAMPYGAAVHAPKWVTIERGLAGGFGSATLDAAGLAAYLEALAEVLGKLADDVEADRAELYAFRRDVAGLRRLLGTEASS